MIIRNASDAYAAGLAERAAQASDIYGSAYACRTFGPQEVPFSSTRATVTVHYLREQARSFGTGFPCVPC